MFVSISVNAERQDIILDGSDVGVERCPCGKQCPCGMQGVEVGDKNVVKRMLKGLQRIVVSCDMRCSVPGPPVLVVDVFVTMRLM